MSDPSLWHLRGFEQHLDLWISTQQPDQDLINLVTAWVLSRFEDPYQGVRREPGFSNLWWGHVPLSISDGEVVVCSYVIEEANRTVTCKSIMPLSWPT
ncbi:MULTISPECIES: hypothetical protein [Micromonospora]|uniref:Uncharacterized protein n=1 Tax=Micromonospora yangpuensis TaxID=683228 RepID=A0A1C6U163_9ACTN|nr:hypothetical protein [Micromonospora yangpuensis]GGM11126.1 hypothetical protein GCM10012279_31440 [Micromonospora yangpuensis]SCL47830.1 hypothetical protein GA0070617_0699 [Micromonospora yangpuensis]